MDHPAHFTAIRRRPQLYGLDGSYGQFCVYLEGMDAGNDGGLLTGFRELLDEFFTRRARPADLARIYDEYWTWKRAQPWQR